MGKKKAKVSGKSEARPVLLRKEDHERLKELRKALMELQRNIQANQAMGNFLLRSYVKENERMESLDYEKGVVMVRSMPKAPETPKEPEAPK